MKNIPFIQEYLKNKDIWDSIFILGNIVLCFIVVGILYLKVPRLFIASVLTNIPDDQTDPTLNCQFSEIVNNPFFIYDIIIQINPVNNFNNVLFLVQTGYVPVRYLDTFSLNDSLQYSISGVTPGGYGSYNPYNYTSDFVVDATIYSNFYHVTEGNTDNNSRASAVVFTRTTCIEAFWLNQYWTFLQQMFNNDIYDTRFRPFIPHFQNNIQSILLNFSCTLENPEYVFIDGLWDQFMIDYNNFMSDIMADLHIEYNCLVVTLEEPFDYFLRLAGYSFIIVLVLLFLQLITNITVSCLFNSEIKELRKSHSKKKIQRVIKDSAVKMNE